MDNRKSDTGKLPADLQQLIQKETPHLVEYLSDVAKKYNGQIHPFFEDDHGERLFFTSAHSTQVFKNLSKSTELLTLFTAAFAQLSTVLSLDNIRYFQTQIADYFFSSVLEQESWKIFWSLQRERLRQNNTHHDIDAIQKQIQGAFVYALAMEWAVSHKSQFTIEMNNQLTVFSKIANALHLQPNEIIHNHQEIQKENFDSYINNLLPVFLKCKNKSKIQQYLTDLEKTIASHRTQVLYSCLEHYDQIIIPGLKHFFESIPEKTNRRKQASAVIVKIMGENGIESDELLKIIKPESSKKKGNKKQKELASLFDFQNEDDDVFSSSSPTLPTYHSHTSPSPTYSSLPTLPTYGGIYSSSTYSSTSSTSTSENGSIKLPTQKSAPEILGGTNSQDAGDQPAISNANTVNPDPVPDKKNRRKQRFNLRSLSVQSVKSTKKNDSGEKEKSKPIPTIFLSSASDQTEDSNSPDIQSVRTPPPRYHFFDHDQNEPTTMIVTTRKKSKTEKPKKTNLRYKNSTTSDS